MRNETAEMQIKNNIFPASRRGLAVIPEGGP